MLKANKPKIIWNYIKILKVCKSAYLFIYNIWEFGFAYNYL